MAATASRSSSSSSARSASAGHLGRLTSVRPGGNRIVSCSLKLELRDRYRGKYLIKVKNRVKQTVQALPRLGLDRAVQEAVDRARGMGARVGAGWPHCSASADLT